uniref:Large ribosomal subunit protein bL19c n=1 Tax=Dichotomaria marginata TaxID=268567 RepID=A0A1G4NSG7_9FLOR|nr:Ribosomal protein L19 [Dichotomaria marginata]SCW21632.1 Ribosomal protein L19 [Dichotomaria marginata]
MNFIVQKKHNLIKEIESQYLQKNIPEIQIGDSLRMGLLIKEGNKERIQYAEGVVIAKHNALINTTITIRKIMQGIGVERLYLLNSPLIKSITITRRSKVRRAKLYYLRYRSGKATRLKQRFE